MNDRLAATDNALAVARDVLRRAPLIDGHNDLPWVIRVDRAARGDVIGYDLAVPEPRSLALLATGLLSLAALLCQRDRHYRRL